MGSNADFIEFVFRFLQPAPWNSMEGKSREFLNWQTLRENSIFGDHSPFSGTIWSLNPNFDTEIRNFIV